MLPKWQLESKIQICRSHPSLKGMKIFGAGPRNLHFSSKWYPCSLKLETCCPGAFTLRGGHTWWTLGSLPTPNSQSLWFREGNLFLCESQARERSRTTSGQTAGWQRVKCGKRACTAQHTRAHAHRAHPGPRLSMAVPRSEPDRSSKLAYLVFGGSEPKQYERP